MAMLATVVSFVALSFVIRFPDVAPSPVLFAVPIAFALPKSAIAVIVFSLPLMVIVIPEVVSAPASSLAV